MNYIALTGCDMHLMAQAAEILLERVSADDIPVAILLHVNELDQARAIRSGLRAGEVGALWRIGGFDPHHLALDHLVDVHLAQASCHCVSAALRGFTRQLQSAPALNSSHPKSESTV